MPSEGRVRNETVSDAVTHRTAGATIRFDAKLSTIDTSIVLRLPATASKRLPSRGQVAVHGTINGVELQTVLEPDGDSGHWMGSMTPCNRLLASAGATLRRSTSR
jgi:hypothetical protein